MLNDGIVLPVIVLAEELVSVVAALGFRQIVNAPKPLNLGGGGRVEERRGEHRQARTAESLLLLDTNRLSRLDSTPVKQRLIGNCFRLRCNLVNPVARTQ